jgi:hypothetical protein
MSFFAGSPGNWYWLADDGRLFSSKSQTLVAADDPDYVTWDVTYDATRWPVDDAGEQTDAALQAVLEPHNMFVNLNYYTVNKRWRTEQGGLTATAGFPIRTDDRSQAKLTGLYTASQENPAVITQYQAADYTVQQIDAAGMLQLHIDLLTHINFCFDTSATMLAGIAAGTITTREQIDAAFDTGSMTQAQKNWLKK